MDFLDTLKTLPARSRFTVNHQTQIATIPEVGDFPVVHVPDLFPTIIVLKTGLGVGCLDLQPPNSIFEYYIR